MQLRKVIPLALALTAASWGEGSALAPSEPSNEGAKIEVASKNSSPAGNAVSGFEDGTLATVTSKALFEIWWLPALVLFLATLFLYIYQQSRIGFYRKLSLGLRAEVVQQEQQRAEIENHSQNLKAVTQKTHLELTQERERADKAERTKESFVSALSHGLRTPLNAVVGSAELLAHTNLTKEQLDYARSIREAGANILSTVNDIVEFYQIESGNVTLVPGEFDLRDSIEDVLSAFSAKAEVMDFDLLYQVDPALPKRISADAHRLKQVLTNLIGSSIRFTEEKDYILVEVKLLEKKDASLRIGFEVKDTGIGVPYEKAMKLFKAGAQVDYSITNKFGGTGLGLTNCEYLVRQMGGTISMEATRGRGTTFAFACDAIAVDQGKVTIPGPLLAGRNILIVDNNPLSAKLLCELLSSWKAETACLPSGAIALRALAAGHSFDLMLVDYRMPGVDGIEFMQSLKSSPYQVPSILLGAPAGGEKDLADAMFDAIVRKPIRRRDLFEKVSALIERRTRNVTDPNPQTKLTVDFAAKYPLRILVAEDDKTNQLLAGRVLSKLGYTCDMVGNGADALSAFDSKKYDMILMDVQMPEMNGMEATARIRQITTRKQPVIIAMTALALSGDREECMRAGMDDYLCKPVQINDLLSLLEKWATTESQNKGVGYFRSSN